MFVTVVHFILAFGIVFMFISILRYAQANFGVRASYYEQISALSDPQKARKLNMGVFVQFSKVIVPQHCHTMCLDMFMIISYFCCPLALVC
jgi:hypothetical protein